MVGEGLTLTKLNKTGTGECLGASLVEFGIPVHWDKRSLMWKYFMSKHHMCHTADICRSTNKKKYVNSYEVTVMKDLPKLSSLERKDFLT